MDRFRKLVDREVLRIAGLSADDLPDFDMWDYFCEEYSEDEAKMAAKECAIALLEDSGFPFAEECADW